MAGPGARRRRRAVDHEAEISRRGAAQRDEADASELERCQAGLVSKPGRQLGEWGYQESPARCSPMEELVRPRTAGRPTVQFFVFDGVPPSRAGEPGRFSADASVAF